MSELDINTIKVGGSMSKCENCQLRKAVARTFDLHWMGEDDCPFQCEVEEGET